MDDREGAAIRVQPEHRPQVRAPTATPGPVNPAIASFDHAGLRRGRFYRIKITQRRVVPPIGAQPKDRSSVRGSAGEARPVEPAIATFQQAADGVGSIIRIAAKLMQELEVRAVPGEAEHDALVRRAALKRRAVEQSVGTFDDLRRWRAAVRSVEVVNHQEARAIGLQAIDRPAIPPSTQTRRTIQIAIACQGERRLGTSADQVREAERVKHLVFDRRRMTTIWSSDGKQRQTNDNAAQCANPMASAGDDWRRGDRVRSKRARSHGFGKWPHRSNRICPRQQIAWGGFGTAALAQVGRA